MKKLFFLLVSGMFLCFTSCEKGGSNPSPAEEDMSFVHTVTVGDNVYLSLFKDLNVQETDNKKSLVFSKQTFFFVHKGKIYVNDAKDAKLYKYGIANGKLVQEGETMVFPSGSWPSVCTFDSDEKAYVSCQGSGKLWIINPTTMQKTGEIDLSAYALGIEEGDKNPDPCTAIIREGILYVALAQEKAKYDPHKGAYMVLIDTRTDTPIKMISDDRASMACAASYEGDPFIDEKGDIYIYCRASFGYIADRIDEGFLRIKKGETEFDPSYYFPVRGFDVPDMTPDVNGNKVNYIYLLAYAGNGKLYAFLNTPGYESRPTPDYKNDKTNQPFEINVYDKSFRKLNFDRTEGWATSIGKVGDYIVAP